MEAVFCAAPKTKTPLGRHRKFSPIRLGAMSLTNSWYEKNISTPIGYLNFTVREGFMDKAEKPYGVLGTYFEQGENFIDTANVYQSEESEDSIGNRLEERGRRDQMVIADKSTAGYRGSMQEKEPIKTTFAGNSMNSIYVSLKDSLQKLKNNYIDILLEIKGL